MRDFVAVLLAGISARFMIQFYRDQNWIALAITVVVAIIIGVIIYRSDQRRRY